MKIEKTDAMMADAPSLKKFIPIHEVESIPIFQFVKPIDNFNSIDEIAAEFSTRLRSSAKWMLNKLGGIGWDEIGEWLKYEFFSEF